MNPENVGVVRGERPFEVEAVRADFPSLHQEVHPGRPLIYFDSAATSLKPDSVVQALDAYMAVYPSNVHRGLHVLSERATEAFEDAREAVASFLGVEDSARVIFTRGTTESINAVAMSWARSALQPGDAILLSELEHHSNLVPWQMVAKEKGLELRFAEITDDARLEMDAIEAALTDRVRLIAVTAMSNVTGTLPPLADIMDLARRRGIRVLIDAAQGLPHGDLDIRRLDPDFVAFSGHKILGPTGVGVLYAKRELLEAMPPFMTGGSMVVRVTRDSAEWNDLPWKFEAGTPPIGEAIALAAALRYLAAFPADQVAAHERSLLEHAHEVLGRIPGLRIVGPTDPAKKGPIASFTMEEAHPHDLAQLLDRHGVAIRAGHHCTMPLHTRLGIPASARASFSLYNTTDEIDRLGEALESIRAMFRRRASKPTPAAARQTSPAH
ncbi:putative cysteine desulfurase [Aquisphaera giovannonii]|uniref:cysteine desulfurase n=1 Tax=Aquisphaera giovannonii TaxID=406548 RepID=A0A5B9WB22_9BACT|nr:SufS family cysteine desulfurase [Aquisphaera giovannonii]QEH37449.1 putative cysteine desulfurase [Aquisphaera giovannonii]